VAARSAAGVYLCIFVQVFGIAFSIIGLLPSIASVLYYPLSNGGGPAMVWGVSRCTTLFGLSAD